MKVFHLNLRRSRKSADIKNSTSSTRNYVEISTIGHDGKSKKRVTKKAHYSDRIWAATNPNFLLSGQVIHHLPIVQIVIPNCCEDEIFLNLPHTALGV